MKTDMKSAYFIELEKLGLSEISDRLGISIEETNELIVKLKYNGRRIIKSKYELKEIDSSEMVDDNDDYDSYSFKYVGIIVYKDIVIKCLPKYLCKEYSTDQKDSLLKLIMQVLRKYGIIEKNMDMISNDDSDKMIDMLNVIVYILTDFIDNGLYHNQKNVYELNGSSEIDWDKTVNNIDPFIIEKRPVYFDLITFENIDNDNDFFRMLHKYVVTQASNMLKEVGLSSIFSLPEVEFDVDENWFVDEEYVINRINSELNVQFVAKKQELLKAMLAFLERKANTEIDDRYQIFGTMDFNLVWEKVCAIGLNNKLNITMDKIPELNQAIVQAKYMNYSKTTKTKIAKSLKELVPYPYWIPSSDLKTTPSVKRHRAKKTLILDIISIFQDKGDKYFIIWDAKYYNLYLKSDDLKGNPGVEDVIKQYIYEVVYKPFIAEQGFNKSYNILLFPTEDDRVNTSGIVEFKEVTASLGANEILAIKFPAKIMFESYILNKKIDIPQYFNL
ncbi:LlaJI family restriction endonuclease [Clostridium beijerinckii]|uniref:LlaJI family restriction endonuclease n=1 Tax=Clostridium beijerinckii TaxID=1520 RepID=UPI0002FB0D6F|nr:LlaJI family restriction endonuclease [Clostridium beijerinckii]